MSENQNPQTQAPAVKRSREEVIREKLAKLHAEYTSLNEELSAILAVAAVGVGNSVVITIGKGEAAKDVVAKVIAVREDEDGKALKVQYGEGFDADITVIKATKIKSLVLPDAPQAAE